MNPPIATMSALTVQLDADLVIPVIPFEMASEYVSRMMAQGTESELFYYNAYHAYYDWGIWLEDDGFTERVFKQEYQRMEMARAMAACREIKRLLLLIKGSR